MVSNLFRLEVTPITSEHSADSSSPQLLFDIAYQVRLVFRGQKLPGTAKTAAVTFGTDPSAVQSDLPQKLAFLGLDSRKHKSLIPLIEERLRNLQSELPPSRMLAFKLDITHIKSSSSLEAINRDGSICGICLEETAEIGAITPCGHVFHGHCIVMWLDKSICCPLCRSIIL